MYVGEKAVLNEFRQEGLIVVFLPHVTSKVYP